MRTTRQPLSRERVLQAAVALADAEGLRAVTMRRLATTLDIEPMSVYYHVPAKEALLDGMVEQVLGAVVAASPSQGRGWREDLRARFLAARAVMLRHPWAPGLISSRRTIPAPMFGYYEWIVATLVDAGFSYHLAHRALHALGSMPLGFAQEIFSPASSGGATDVEAAEEDLSAMASALPHLTAMVASEIHDAGDPHLGWCDSQVEFEFTLDLLLDGLARTAEPSADRA